MNIKIMIASKLENIPREKISRIFSEGFGHWLTFFSKDIKVLTKAFSHMFLLEEFYIAIVDGEIAGITACTNGKSAPVKFDKKELKKHFGFVKGTIAGKLLKSYLSERSYPFSLSDNTGSIEYVAVSEKFRRQGIAETLIQHIIENTSYQNYVLDVADTNFGAVKLYKKLGFSEIHKVKEKHPKQSGFNYLLYMKYSK